LGSKVKVAGKSKILAANTLASPVSRLHGEHGDDDQRSATQRNWTRLVSVAMKIILTFDIKDGPDTIIELIKILQAVGADTRIQIEPSEPAPIQIEPSEPAPIQIEPSAPRPIQIEPAEPPPIQIEIQIEPAEPPPNGDVPPLGEKN
jgi:hypothetical protein